MTAPVCERLLVVGLGLIGGSLALAARRCGAVREVLAVSRSAETIRTGIARGLIDDGATDYGSVLDRLQPGDVILVSTPTLAVPAAFAAVQSAVARGVILTDAASVKGSVVAAAREVFGDWPATFVPGHPIAGSEKNGVLAAVPELYRHRRVILTPTAASSAGAVRTVRQLWEAVGAEVLEMPAALHDELLAATSHLPHVLAYALVDALAQHRSGEDLFRFAAGGFRDFTRIVASDPQMWHDIVLANREALLAELDRYTQHLAGLRSAIAQQDSAAILALFGRARAAREHFAALFENTDSAEK